MELNRYRKSTVTLLSILMSLLMINQAFAGQFTVDDYAYKISSPQECYGRKNEIYESFNATSTNKLGWQFCNQYEGDSKDPDKTQISEIYICNSHSPNEWLIYDNEMVLTQETRVKNHVYETDFFLSQSDVKEYQRRCNGDNDQCSGTNPYPTFSQPICQCTALLDHQAFQAADSTKQSEMRAEYEIELPFHEGEAEFKPLKVTGSRTPCYYNIASVNDEFFRWSQSNNDSILINVKSMPQDATIYFQHAAYPHQELEFRNRNEITAPTTDGPLKFRNYERIYVLLLGKGDFELEYKREFVKPPEDPNADKYALYITIYCGAVMWIIAAIFFEGKNCIKCIRNRHKGNSTEVKDNADEKVQEEEDDDLQLNKSINSQPDEVASNDEEDAGFGGRKSLNKDGNTYKRIN